MNKDNHNSMKPILTILFFVLFLEGNAQTNNSPYSIYGIGDLEDGYFNRTAGLANTGIAYRSNRNLITNNPASFSALDNQFFAGEVGIRGRLINYYGKPINSANAQSSDITFKRFAVGTKITKHWGTSLGLVPFSSVNYEFNTNQPVLGTVGETSPAYVQGNGGINRVYWANAYEFFHHLSIGVNASYLFGSVAQKTILENLNTPSTYVSTNKTTNYGNVYLDYGIQYYGKINKKWDFIIGGTFANRTNLSANYNVTIYNIDSTELKNESNQLADYTLPTSFGVGLSLTRNKKYTFLADYKYQGWSSLNYSGNNYGLQNSERASIGFEISNKRNIYNTLFETSYFHAGLYYGQTYLNVYGEPIKDMGVTLGAGINAKRSALSYAVTLQYGIRGTQSKELIQERYFNIGLLFSYRDFWYTKGRKYD
jgi:hypothetical protein